MTEEQESSTFSAIKSYTSLEKCDLMTTSPLHPIKAVDIWNRAGMVDYAHLEKLEEHNVESQTIHIGLCFRQYLKDFVESLQQEVVHSQIPNRESARPTYIFNNKST